MQAPRPTPRAPRRRDHRAVLHLDYDAFYCAVVEQEHPPLKLLPLAVQRRFPPCRACCETSADPAAAEKQIIVTCNYEARRRGLHKLQLVKEAKRLCPDLVIVLGEDLTRFRNASKLLYRFLCQFSWNARVERLGFDEVWLDVTDQVEYNVNLLNQNDLTNAYFCLSKDDPTHGFAFDATQFAGNTYPASDELSNAANHEPLRLRLLLGSHLARHVRAELEHQTGYTATAGVSTNKFLSKLVGSVNKPNGLTTLVPPYDPNATSFVDDHDIGKLPGIGFKLAQKLRKVVLQRAAAFSDGLVYGGTQEQVSAGDVRKHVGVSAESLERILAGPGSPHGIGAKVWGLLHGVDDSEVGQVRGVPRQISVEDSYMRLDTLAEVTRELKRLAVSLIKRMRLDLLEDEEGDDKAEQIANAAGAEICNSSLLPSAAEALAGTSASVRSAAPQPARQRWIAHPRTLRLSTRPRPPVDPATNTRPRTFARMSRSALLLSFVFSLTTSVDSIAERLVDEALLPLFRRLHPEKSGWNLSLMNVAVTKLADCAGDARTSSGRDIGAMFKEQHRVLSQWRVTDGVVAPHPSDDHVTIGEAEGSGDGIGPEAGASRHEADVSRNHAPNSFLGSYEPRGIETVGAAVDARCTGSEDVLMPGMSSQDSHATLEDGWMGEAEGGVCSDETAMQSTCCVCSAVMPAFAMAAHMRFHAPGG